MANRREFNDVRLFFTGRLKAIIDEVVPLKDDAAAQRHGSRASSSARSCSRP